MIGTRTLVSYLALAALAAAATGAPAQRPPVRGALDSMTVVPATGTAPANPPALPTGHPAMPGSGAGGGGGAGADDPLTAIHGDGMAGAKVGALRVNFSQGTKGGPALGKDPVTVRLFSQGVSLKTIKTFIDDKGMVELHDLPLEVAFQPVISVEHGGAEEQLIGPPMHKLQPMIELDMPVFETTAEKPAWTIGLRDIDVVAVDLGPLGAGLQFTELIGGFNPTDRAWTGEIVGGTGAGERRTMTIPLAADATDVQFGPGLAEADAKVEGGAVVRGKTMLPGSRQYVFGYTIAPKGGKVTATFTMPADTTLFALYVPGDAKVESLAGLELGAAGGANGAQNRQLLKAKTVKAGQTLSVVLSGFKAPVVVTKPVVPPQTSDLHLPVPATKPESKP